MINFSELANGVEDGVYFQMRAETYHAIPALSSTGIKNILISGPDFWYRSPWLNPAFEDEDSEARVIGKAYHTRILEGRDKFYQLYAEKFSSPKGCLRTVDDIKHALRELGIDKPKGLKPDLIEQLLELNPAALIEDELELDYKILHHGKEFLSGDLVSKIEIAAAMIEKHPEISKCFKGGFPEVSVVWTEGGIRFKARFDYLKPRSIIDLKTFANFLNKSIDDAIYGAMASGKYHIQAAFYIRAFQAARALARPIDFPGNDEWLAQFSDCQDPGFYFVFSQKGVAPLARAKKFTRDSIWSCGEVAIEEAISRFKINADKFGMLPWIDDHPIEEFEADQFPAYTTNL